MDQRCRQATPLATAASWRDHRHRRESGLLYQGWLVIAVTVALVLAAAGREYSDAQAQTPMPSPTPPLMFGVGSATIPPGAVASFAIRFAPIPPGQPIPRGRPPAITVENRSTDPIATTYSAGTLILDAPAGLILRIVNDEALDACTPTVGTALRCWAFAMGSKYIVVTTGVSDAPTEQVSLPAGCSNVVLSWPRYTPLRVVAEAIDPPGALDSIWRYIPARQRFYGFKPSAPIEVNDYQEISAPLEAVFLCLRAPGMLTRPLG